MGEIVLGGYNFDQKDGKPWEGICVESVWWSCVTLGSMLHEFHSVALVTTRYCIWSMTSAVPAGFYCTGPIREVTSWMDRGSTSTSILIIFDSGGHLYLERPLNYGWGETENLPVGVGGLKFDWKQYG